MRPSSAKSRGRRLQAHIREEILAVFPGLGSDDVISRSSGSGGEDLILSPAARALVALSIEAKNTTAAPGLKAIEQARANAKGHLACVVWHPRGAQYCDSLITFSLRELLQFLAARGPAEASGSE